jgi:DNA-binding GntR family transcriptional regulator
VSSAEDLDHLAGLIEQMDLAKAQHDRSKYVPANRDFHFTIYRAAGSDALMSIIESLWLQIGSYFDLLKATGNWWTANVEHKALRDALVRKDGDAAAGRCKPISRARQRLCKASWSPKSRRRKNRSRDGSVRCRNEPLSACYPPSSHGGWAKAS